MNNQPFFIDTFREFLDQYNRKEISISKLVEDLNTVAHSWATDTEKKATWAIQDIDLITDYADFDAKAKIKMIENRIQKFWKDNPAPLTQPADVQERAKEYIRSKYGNPVKRGSVSSIDDVGDAYLAGNAGASSMQEELQQLRDWKESAMKVMNDIDLQECGKVIGVKLGHDVSPEILPALKRLRAALEEIKDQSSEWESPTHNRITDIATEALNKQQ